MGGAQDLVGEHHAEPLDLRVVRSDQLDTESESRRGLRVSILTAVVLGAIVVRLLVAAWVPVTDTTEGRYAQIAKEMASSGDLITPRLWMHGEHIPYLGKPPLFFWTAAASIRVFGANEFAVRLPSFVALVLFLVFMECVLRPFIGPQAARSASLITASSALVFTLSASVIVDMHLMLFVGGALLCQLAFVNASDPRVRRNWSLATFALLGLGFLTKGPVALVLVCLPVLVWTLARRRWLLHREQAWAQGGAIFLIIVAPWFILAELENPGFLRYFFLNENFLRYLAPDYGDLYGAGRFAPRGAAAVMFIIATLPWSPVAAVLLIRDRRRGSIHSIRTDITSFLIFGFAVQVLFWCFARQLLITYLLPSIPLFAAWAAQSLEHQIVPRRIASRLAMATLVLLSGLLVAWAPQAAKRSTRSILDVDAHFGSNDAATRIVFAQHTPPSAHFYSPDRVIPHPWESAAATVDRALASQEPTVMAVRGALVSEIPSLSGNRLVRIFSRDGWHLFGSASMTDSSSETRARDFTGQSGISGARAAARVRQSAANP